MSYFDTIIYAQLFWENVAYVNPCNVQLLMNIPCKRFENVFYPIKISIEERKKEEEERQVLHCLLYSFHMEVGSFRNLNNFKEVKKNGGGYNKLKTKY
jgi:hypothetical protein